MVTHPGIEDNVLAWLREQGAPAPELTPLPGGANNQAFRVDSEHGPFLLKRYFRHPRDPRDRLAAEFAFLEHLWNCEVRKTAKPLAQNADLGLGLYSFIEGRPATQKDVNQAHAEEALSFALAINRTGQPATLGDASEACFTLAAHVACVDRRVQALDAIEGAARVFIQEELAPAWQTVRSQIPERSAALPRCLSPSDFGFHNAIISEGGEIVFIDFEYAGWDDPAKLICDFFSQPRLPVPFDTRPAFIAGLRVICEDEKLADRVRMLWPLYRIKWICIILNSLLPLGKARRDFAGRDDDAQVEKARGMLTQIEWKE
jgi:Ser/Thr protein kinase RdoA (MazF antagonist)